MRCFLGGGVAQPDFSADVQLLSRRHDLGNHVDYAVRNDPFSGFQWLRTDVSCTLFSPTRTSIKAAAS